MTGLCENDAQQLESFQAAPARAPDSTAAMARVTFSHARHRRPHRMEACSVFGASAGKASRNSAEPCTRPNNVLLHHLLTFTILTGHPDHLCSAM